MSRAAKKVDGALFGAAWDVASARERIKLIISGDHEWKDPRAVTLEAIDSAIENLNAARKAALKL